MSSTNPTEKKVHEHMGKEISVPLAVFFIVGIIFSALILIQITPIDIEDVKKNHNEIVTYVHFPSNQIPSIDITTHLTLIAIFGGIAGSSIHALSSMAHFSHEKKLDKNYTLWYISRPFLGAIMSLVVYFAVLGGILTNLEFDMLNPYGVTTIGVVTGLFTQRVLNRFGKVVDAMFGIEKKVDG